MIKKALFTFATVAIAVASAASSYRVTVLEPSVINGTELKPGEYKIELKGSTAIITRGKQSIESPVKIESAPSKFSATPVRYTKGNGEQPAEEIRLGGTNTKLVFNSTVSVAR